jgi:tetratricopeptide (TPR) repeat protein
MKPFDEIPPGTDEDRSRALLEQANALFKEGRFKASEVTFKRVIDGGSKVAEGFYGVGVVRLSRNDQAAAETNFRRALEHDPWHANALYQLGLMDEQREDLEQARSYYRKALATNPEHVGAQKGLARLSDSDSQSAPVDTNDYDPQSERLQETMIVRLEKPVELVV